MRIIRLMLPIFLVIGFYACENYSDEVNRTILSAGDNKKELISAVEFYRGADSLKFQAMEYLVANMRFHSGLDSMPHSAEILPYVFADDGRVVFPDSLLALAIASADSTLRCDAEYLTCDFLTRSVDVAFESMSRMGTDSIPFDIIKRYIVPYRANEEPLMADRAEIADMFLPILSTEGLMVDKIDRYNDFVKKKRRIWRNSDGTVQLGTSDIFVSSKRNDCRRMSALTCQVLRTCGIPSSVEYTPQWRNSADGHYWVGVYSDGRFRPFSPPYNNIDNAWESSIRFAGKIYRFGYEVNKDAPAEWIGKDAVILPVFKNRFIFDVTPEYHPCADEVEIPFDKGDIFPGGIGFLSFFNAKLGSALHPVGWGVVDEKKKVVRYKSVPENMLFFPTRYDRNGAIRLFAKPFIVRISENGKRNVEYLDCDYSEKQSIRLLRKFPSKLHHIEYRQDNVGTKLLGANNLNGPYDTIFIIEERPIPNWQRYLINSAHKYRYYKFVNGRGKSLNIAEYELLTDKNDPDTKPASKLPVYSPIQIPDRMAYYKYEGLPLDSDAYAANAVDGDLETFVETPWCGIDLGSPKKVKAVQIFPRSARNEIASGHTYLLLYFDGHKWIPIARKATEYNYIDFDGVPKGALLWLRDLTEGKDELPFFYKDGRQVFISDL